jgi:hypothetical protein
MWDGTPSTKPHQYARLKTFLLNHGYVMGSVDKTLFTLKHGNDFLLGQIYMDDIILWLFWFACLMFSWNDGEWLSDVDDGRTNLFLSYPSQANKAGHFRTLSQVHKGIDEEIQHGWA